MIDRWQIIGDFSIKRDYGYGTQLERQKRYLNGDLNGIIQSIELLGYKDKSTMFFIKGYKSNYKFLKQKYEEAGYGKIEFLDKEFQRISFHVNPNDNKRLQDFVTFLKNIEPMTSVYADLKKVLQLNESAEEMHTKLITLYNTEGFGAAFIEAQQALVNGYEDVFFALAKNAQATNQFDDTLHFLLNTQSIQSEEANQFRLNFAQFIYDAHIKNQDAVLELLLITNNEEAINLRTNIFNERSKVVGSKLAIKQLNVSSNTLIQLSNLIQELSQSNNSLLDENKRLKEEIVLLKQSKSELTTKKNLLPLKNSSVAALLLDGIIHTKEKKENDESPYSVVELSRNC